MYKSNNIRNNLRARPATSKQLVAIIATEFESRDLIYFCTRFVRDAVSRDQEKRILYHAEVRNLHRFCRHRHIVQALICDTPRYKTIRRPFTSCTVSTQFPVNRFGVLKSR